MDIQVTSPINTGSRNNPSADTIDLKRRQQSEDPGLSNGTGNATQLQPEELLSQIKAITEDGLYSVQFESNDNSQLIVKVVDRETNEVIRQIPPEELIELSEHLRELTGNLINTVG